VVHLRLASYYQSLMIVSSKSKSTWNTKATIYLALLYKRHKHVDKSLLLEELMPLILFFIEI